MSLLNGLQRSTGGRQGSRATGGASERELYELMISSHEERQKVRVPSLRVIVVPTSSSPGTADGEQQPS